MHVVLLQMLAQLQAQQGGGSLPQQIKLQLPIQIQQGGTTSAPAGQVSGLHTPGGSTHFVKKQPIQPIVRKFYQTVCPKQEPLTLCWPRTAVLMMVLCAQVGNVVTIQAASVQEQLQRIQQLREQQQQKKRQAAEAKREQALSSTSQSDIIQKQVCSAREAAPKTVLQSSSFFSL